MGKKRVVRTWKYLVKWTGYDDSENTWEPKAHVCHLTGKVAAARVLS